MQRSTRQTLTAALLSEKFGIITFLLIMFTLFELTFLIGSPIAQLLLNALNIAQTAATKNITIYELHTVLEATFLGVGAIIAFLPIFALLSAGLALLEYSGYNSRMGALFGVYLRKFGLDSACFLPLIIGFSCSIPAYIAAQGIKSYRHKIATMFAIGFMSCSAKLNVYALIAGAIFSPKTAGLVTFALYILGISAGLLVAKCASFSIKDKCSVHGNGAVSKRVNDSDLKINWRKIGSHVKSQTLSYLNKASGVIIAVSILLWALTNFPFSLEDRRRFSDEIHDCKAQNTCYQQFQQYSQARLKHSALVVVGTKLSGLFKPMDFDWRLTTTLLAGLAGKEMSLVPLSVLYGTDESGIEGTLQEKLRANISTSSGVAFLVFMLLYMPCLSATRVFAKETGQKKYLVALIASTTLIAWIMSFVAYKVVAFLT